MALNAQTVGFLLDHCSQTHQKVRYGILGACLAGGFAGENTEPRHYGMAVTAILNALFQGPAPDASWVVNGHGLPTGYLASPNNAFHPAWHLGAPAHATVLELMDWLDQTLPRWRDAVA